MDRCPDELEFISLFQCLPTKKREEDPFWYNESTFSFERDHKKFQIKISPFYNQFSMSVRDEDDEIFKYDFQTVTNIEILSDKKDFSQLRLFLEDDRDRFLTIVDITVKPKLIVLIKEAFR